MSVKPIAPPVETGFEWHNYFNPNDALGWPLQPLGRGYETLVADHSILASNLLTCWNPFSHGAYWSDPSVIGAVAGQLARALGPREAGAGAAVRGLPSAAADA